MSQRKRLPNRRYADVVSFTDKGRRWTAYFGRQPNGAIGEIFLDSDKPNSAIATHVNTAAILASMLMQYGVDLKTIRHSITGPLAVALSLAEEKLP
jgi:hypothetical protein